MGEYSSYSVTAGVRFYFGPDKSLIRRHREDDPPSGVTPAAQDEVSAAFANLFATHAHDYQAQSGQAAQFHQAFIDALP